MSFRPIKDFYENNQFRILHILKYVRLPMRGLVFFISVVMMLDFLRAWSTGTLDTILWQHIGPVSYGRDAPTRIVGFLYTCIGGYLVTSQLSKLLQDGRRLVKTAYHRWLKKEA